MGCTALLACNSSSGADKHGGCFDLDMHGGCSDAGKCGGGSGAEVLRLGSWASVRAMQVTCQPAGTPASRLTSQQTHPPAVSSMPSGLHRAAPRARTFLQYTLLGTRFVHTLISFLSFTMNAPRAALSCSAQTRQTDAPAATSLSK